VEKRFRRLARAELIGMGKLGTSGQALVENGSLVYHQNHIYPGWVCQWGPMTGIGPGSCRLVASPGSFRRIGPGLWHESGPMPPSVARGSLRSIGPGSCHELGLKTLPWL
jgi:hypothetical protein